MIILFDFLHIYDPVPSLKILLQLFPTFEQQFQINVRLDNNREGRIDATG